VKEVNLVFSDNFRLSISNHQYHFHLSIVTKLFKSDLKIEKKVRKNRNKKIQTNRTTTKHLNRSRKNFNHPIDNKIILPLSAIKE